MIDRASPATRSLLGLKLPFQQMDQQLAQPVGQLSSVTPRHGFEEIDKVGKIEPLVLSLFEQARLFLQPNRFIALIQLSRLHSRHTFRCREDGMLSILRYFVTVRRATG